MIVSVNNTEDALRIEQVASEENNLPVPGGSTTKLMTFEPYKSRLVAIVPDEYSQQIWASDPALTIHDSLDEIA